MQCAHCGHELSTRRMLFGSRFMGGWRCTACDQMFYADARDFKPAVSQWRFLALYFAAILLLLVLVFAGLPIWGGLVLFALVIASLVFANLSMNRAQWHSMRTYTAQPSGQREATRLRLSAFLVFWGGWYTDFLLIQRFEATEPFHAILTVVCGFIAAALLFRAWQIKWASPASTESA